jgi:hypothetical protein
MNPQSNSNNFFGQKVSVPGVNVNNATPSQLLYSNDYSLQTFYGTNGNIGFGVFTSSVTGEQTVGMQIENTAGQVTFEMDGQTWFWFDSSGNNIMQVGLLVNSAGSIGLYGWAVATPGNSLLETL